jgi:hypothetical protein
MHTIVRPHRVVDHIVEHLAAIDEDYVFGVDGVNIEDLYDAAYFCTDLPRSWLRTSSPQRRWLMVIAAVGGVGRNVRDIRRRLYPASRCWLTPRLERT